MAQEKKFNEITITEVQPKDPYTYIGIFRRMEHSLNSFADKHMNGHNSIQAKLLFMPEMAALKAYAHIDDTLRENISAYKTATDWSDKRVQQSIDAVPEQRQKIDSISEQAINTIGQTASRVYNSWMDFTAAIDRQNIELAQSIFDKIEKTSQDVKEQSANIMSRIGTRVSGLFQRFTGGRADTAISDAIEDSAEAQEIAEQEEDQIQETENAAREEDLKKEQEKIDEGRYYETDILTMFEEYQEHEEEMREMEEYINQPLDDALAQAEMDSVFDNIAIDRHANTEHDKSI